MSKPLQFYTWRCLFDPGLCASLLFCHLFSGSLDRSMIGMVEINTLAERMDDRILSFAVVIERIIENDLKWRNEKRVAEWKREEEQCILDAVPNGFAYVDFEGKLVRGNQHFLVLFDLKAENLIDFDITNWE